MMTLITGPQNSGRSALAEDICCSLAGDEQKIYIATMIVQDEAGEERIKKHRQKRSGKNFLTVELPKNLATLEVPEVNLSQSVCLLECVTNLVGNEMHAPENQGFSDEALSNLVVAEVLHLKERVKHLVAVSGTYEELPDYDADTLRFVRLLHHVNEVLTTHADRVEVL